MIDVATNVLVYVLWCSIAVRIARRIIRCGCGAGDGDGR